jgi:hypothetical protein
VGHWLHERWPMLAFAVGLVLLLIAAISST